MAKRRSCHNKLTAKKRKLLVAEFQFEDQLIVDDVLEVFGVSNTLMSTKLEIISDSYLDRRKKACFYETAS